MAAAKRPSGSPLPAIAILAHAYSQRITDPSTVIERLSTITSDLPVLSAKRAEIAHQLFMIFLKRYLAGSGHVYNKTMRESGLVTAHDARKENKNRILRAELFLKAATGSPLIPIEEDWEITVCLSICRS